MCGPHVPHGMQQCARWQGMGVVADVCIGPRDVFWGLSLDGPTVARGRCAHVAARLMAGMTLPVPGGPVMHALVSKIARKSFYGA